MYDTIWCVWHKIMCMTKDNAYDTMWYVWHEMTCMTQYYKMMRMTQYDVDDNYDMYGTKWHIWQNMICMTLDDIWHNMTCMTQCDMYDIIQQAWHKMTQYDMFVSGQALGEKTDAFQLAQMLSELVQYTLHSDTSSQHSWPWRLTQHVASDAFSNKNSVHNENNRYVRVHFNICLARFIDCYA